MLPLAETCAICLEHPSEWGRLDCCEHTFCFHCVTMWGHARSNTCPICRRPFQRIVPVSRPGHTIDLDDPDVEMTEAAFFGEQQAFPDEDDMDDVMEISEAEFLGEDVLEFDFENPLTRETETLEVVID